MKKDKFYKEAQSQQGCIYEAAMLLEAREISTDLLMCQATDLRLIAKSLEDLCEMVEMEGLHD